MKKLLITLLVLAVNIVFCQQNKAKETATETITSFSNVERKYDNSVKLKLIVENDASCIIKSNHTVILEEGFVVREGAFYVGPDDGTVAKAQIKENLFSISPNPSSSTISISSGANQITNVAVISIEGKRVFETKTAPITSYELDVSSLSNGVYVLNIQTANAEVVTQKFIKE